MREEREERYSPPGERAPRTHTPAHHRTPHARTHTRKHTPAHQTIVLALILTYAKS